MNSSIEPGIFRNPRLKKSLLPPPNKRHKVGHKIDEISFDINSREEYLTGFHKRKVARIKNAKAEAEKKSKEDRRIFRKKLREERKQELEEHIEAVNAALKTLDNPSDNEKNLSAEASGGLSDVADLVSIPTDYGEEFIDEEKYTTVTVEAIDVSKNGLYKKNSHDIDIPKIKPEAIEPKDAKKIWPKKSKKKKFRYESKAERKLQRTKEKLDKRKYAATRKNNK
ncbi:Ribosomal RNA-processing protein 17 [Erysiphe neolycopersici]|uniref:Ribosomal RNA-processing protein 17 n=1 Tax=Erysiphe neolycopersici TaxID=212602 RepID=A0A420HXB3_9PEZI|nr:Ribosomal RNA-processing protein 17 [Erysiphe neolycopersici]